MVKDARNEAEAAAAEVQKTMTEGVEKLTRSVEDAAQFGQENLDAVVASSRIAAKAHETVGAEVAAFTKKSYEDSLAAAKDLSASRSVSELMEKQTAYGKSAFEAYVSQATKINDIYVAAAKEAFQPLTERFTAAVEKARGVRA